LGKLEVDDILLALAHEWCCWHINHLLTTLEGLEVRPTQKRGAEERGVLQTFPENGQEKQCHKRKKYEEKGQEKGKNLAKIGSERKLSNKRKDGSIRVAHVSCSYRLPGPRNGHMEVIPILLDREAEVAAVRGRDEDGLTALHLMLRWDVRRLRARFWSVVRTRWFRIGMG
jgi:hypothetical protein